MGTIWLAHDELLDRQIAVKEVLLPPSLAPAERAEAVQRSMREAMAAAQVRHPGIITIHDVVSQDQRPWIVMELLVGRDLKDAVAAEGPWAPERVAALGLRVLEALTVAHAHGIQHRDVKPANVFLSHDGRVILTDFGIARLEDQATITESGLLIGSPGFIAPERLRGERGGPESDLWSLAATLYAAVEGQAPYVGTSPMSILRDALTMPPRPPQRAGHLGPVLTQMLAREPYQRPVAQAAAQLLQRVAEGRPAVAPPPARGGRRVPILVGAGVAVLLAAGAGAVMLRSGTAPPPRQPVTTPLALTSTTPTPAPTPTPSPEETAKFNGPVDFCGLLTRNQVRALLPSAPAGENSDGGCDWAVRGAGIGAEPRHQESESLDDAKETFSNALNSGLRETKMTWNWPAIGLTKNLTQTRRPAKELDGIGDEAFGYDYVSPAGRVELHTVVFRVSNLVVEVDHVNIKKIGDDAAVRKGAVDAARLLARALDRQE